jgi:alpha-1,2-mannosyltransferase
VLLAILVLVDASLMHRSWSRGWSYAALRPSRANGWRGLGYAAGAALVYLLFVIAPMENAGSPLAANAYALALILLVNAVPWRPGVAPAFPINRWAKRSRRPQPIPPARRPVS